MVCVWFELLFLKYEIHTSGICTFYYFKATVSRDFATKENKKVIIDLNWFFEECKVQNVGKSEYIHPVISSWELEEECKVQNIGKSEYIH